jgi:dipeptidyl-peptidase-4
VRSPGPPRIDDLVDLPRPGMDHPTRIEFSRDGRATTFLAPEPGGNLRSLWRLDLTNGKRTVLAGADPAPNSFTQEEELRRQRRHETAFGITDYRRAENADLIVAMQGARCIASRDGRPAVELPGASEAQATYPDPSGQRIAWVRASDLWCGDIAKETARRVTHDAEPGVTNGLEDFLAAEELDRFEGAWWSTSGAELLFAHVDERHIPLVSVAAAGSAAERAGREMYRYPFAGGPNPRTTLRITAPDGDGVERDAELDFADGYLARVVPHPLGGWLVAALPRDQTSLHWYLVDASGSATELWIERSQPWITLDNATRVLSDGRVVRATETTGYRHLELRNADGTALRSLTTGAWVVTDLMHVDEVRGEVLFVGTADGVLERHLYTVPLDGRKPVAKPRRLTAEAGWHAVMVSDDGNRWVDTWSTRSRPPRVVVRSRDGSADVIIHEPSTDASRAGLVVPDVTTLPAADGATDLQVAIFRPQRPAGAPIGASVVWVYGGPHSQYVGECWDLTVEPYRQALARSGFTVVVADNRGTANRGLAFESPIAGALGTVEVDDQVAVLDSLARRGEVDLDRIAITGSSYGGYLTVRAMSRRPDLFRTGVAGAPVVDWSGYDTAYTERYLNRPSSNPDMYRRASLLDGVASFRGQLLLIHGSVDENVHPRHTSALVEALHAGGRDAAVVLLPNQRHLVARPAAKRRWLSLALRHLRTAMRQQSSGTDAGARRSSAKTRAGSRTHNALRAGAGSRGQAAS